MSTDAEFYGGSMDGKTAELDELFDKDTITIEALMKYKIVLEDEIYILKKERGKYRLVYLGTR